MNKGTLFITALLVLAAVGGGVVANMRRHPAVVAEAPTAPSVAGAPRVPQPILPPAPNQSPAPPVTVTVPSPPAPLPPRNPAAPSPAQGGVAQVDAGAARQALARVGIDPQAEAVWTVAINDTTLPNGVRKNLIEDLNETGFSDPRNLTPADLPVIENRIALIERLGPDAVDDTNYAAFQEAYKDLLNMRARIAGN